MARAVPDQRVWTVASRTFLAFLLTSALFVAPFVAAGQDFAHVHPDGSPHHVHSVSGTLGATVITAPLELVVVAAVLCVLALLLPCPELPLRPAGANGIRAPPIAIL